jgi:hypothetical protein
MASRERGSVHRDMAAALTFRRQAIEAEVASLPLSGMTGGIAAVRC